MPAPIIAAAGIAAAGAIGGAAISASGANKAADKQKKAAKKAAQAQKDALALLVLKWKASDDAERAGQADARSFVWRAAYYDLVLLVVLLTKGHATAMKDAVKVMHLYGETLHEYLKEFS